MNIVIFGASGFLGKKLLERIPKKHRVTAVRSHECSIVKKTDVVRVTKQADVIINLVGLSPLKKPTQSYYDVHVTGVKNILAACKKHTVSKLIHISALADDYSQTEYLRTKKEAEECIVKSGLAFTIFRPSVIYDTESELTNVFNLCAKLHIYPDINAKVQPVYRHDVTEQIVMELGSQKKSDNTTIELVGPETMTIGEMAKQYIATKTKVSLPIPFVLIKLGMVIGAIIPFIPIGFDQVKNLHINSVSRHSPQKVAYSTWLQKK